MNIAAEQALKVTAELAAEYGAAQGINFDSEIAASYVAQTAKDRIPKIIEAARKDAELADLFGHLKKGKVTELVRARLKWRSNMSV